MTSVEILGKVVTILRVCDWCGQTKDRDQHFAVRGGRMGQILKYVHICATCRRSGG